MTPVGRWLAWLAVAVQALVVAACRPASPPPSSRSSRAASDAASRDPATSEPEEASHRRGRAHRETPIHFERLGGKPFPYPLVRARVRGVETWLILDSGASHTVLDTWLVEQLGVQLSPSDQPGEDHAGQPVATMLARSPHLELIDWGRLPERDVLAVTLPAVFHRLGLGGVISPQSLALPGALVVVDLPGSTLSLIPRSAIGLADAAASLGEGHSCVVGGETPGVVFMVDATVEGQPARLVVDSGSEHSDLLANSRPGRHLAARSSRGGSSYTASGKVQVRRLQGAQMRVGTVAKRLDVAILPGAPSGACPRDGHLGLDVLRRCVLFFAPDHFTARCRHP